MSTKYSFYSNCGCLHSESMAALRKFTKNSPQKLQSDKHGYSQTCLQNLSNADSLKNMFISKESIHVVKLNTLRKRMVVTLNGIQSLLGDRPQPDGVEDLKRRQQRAAEFSSRFCRNYMYPLQRQMNVIAKMWKNLSLNHSHSAYFSLCQKVIATHQSAHSALEAYFHHMPSSVEKGVPDKLEELLQVVNNLCSLCSKLDMSEGESDFNSKRVKKQCEQLMLQIKAEVIDEEGESSAGVSHSCAQKESTSTPNKGATSHRFSMYSRNSVHKSSSNQNKKAMKSSVTSKKKFTKSLYDRHSTNEAHFSSNCKQKDMHGKLTAHKIHENDMVEGSEIGEVCASDDVKTMMEFFLAEEVPMQCKPSSRRGNSKRTIPSFLTELDKQSLPSMSTLRKLEGEIKNLKKQTKSLKEFGHPNYPVYIKALETMSQQLSGIKSQKHISNSPSFQAIKQTRLAKQSKDIVNGKIHSDFPKNVKLICLSSEADIEHTYTTPRDSEKAESPPTDVNKIKNVQEDECSNNYFYQGKAKNEILTNGLIQITYDWKLPETSKLYEINQKKTSLELLPELTDSQSTCDISVGVQHPNTPITESSSKDRRLNNSEDRDPQKGVKLTISQQEISSAIAYHQVFQDHMNSNSLYEKSMKPWLMVARLANHLMDNILEEITLNDIGIQKITSGLLQLEFQ